MRAEIKDSRIPFIRCVSVVLMGPETLTQCWEQSPPVTLKRGEASWSQNFWLQVRWRVTTCSGFHAMTWRQFKRAGTKLGITRRIIKKTTTTCFKKAKLAAD